MNKVSRIYQKEHSKEFKLIQDLFLNVSFLKSIVFYRNSHNIPKLGFKDLKKYAHWESQYKSPRVDGVFKEELITLDSDDKPMVEHIRHKKAKISKLIIDVYKILADFDLSLEWYPSILNYILFNDKPKKMNVYKLNLYRKTFNGIKIHEEISFNFGATLKAKDLFKKLSGKSIWLSGIEPLQETMQGYKEKSKRPSRLKTRLARKVFQERLKKKPYVDIQYDHDDKINTIGAAKQLHRRYLKKIKLNR